MNAEAIGNGTDRVTDKEMGSGSSGTQRASSGGTWGSHTHLPPFKTRQGPLSSLEPGWGDFGAKPRP